MSLVRCSILHCDRSGYLYEDPGLWIVIVAGIVFVECCEETLSRRRPYEYESLGLGLSDIYVCHEMMN